MIINTNSIQNILQDCIQHAKDNKYTSYDVSDLLKTRYYKFSKDISNSFINRLVRYPYSYLRKYYPDFIRKFVSDKGYIYPQGQAMMIRAFVTLARKNNVLGDIEEAKKIAQWLIENRSPHSKQFGWGQPFLWYSRKPFPPNIPRATVSSQVGWAMLDLYDYTGDIQYLDVAQNICELFKSEFNYTPDRNGNFCLSYTTIDNYHVHNASMLAASLIFRVARLKNNEALFKFGTRLVDFTVSHQNSDGSFYYWAPPDKINFMIDNYHTGFVLESFKTICEDCGDDRYDSAFKKGMEYYYNNLFDGPIPNISSKNKFPIDIQACAQSIITFQFDDLPSKYGLKANSIADYTLKTFYLKDKLHFAYKLYANNHLDKSYYFRWGDAWMIRALSYLI